MNNGNKSYDMTCYVSIHMVTIVHAALLLLVNYQLS